MGRAGIGRAPGNGCEAGQQSLAVLFTMATAILRTMFKFPLPKNLRRRKRKIATNQQGSARLSSLREESFRVQDLEAKAATRFACVICGRLRVSGLQTFPL